MRSTKQKKIILEILKNHSDHPGADILYHEVRKVLPHISLGTVYRNLELLSETGTIRKLEFGSSQRKFDPNTEPHSHFRCVKCGNMEDLPFNTEPADPDRHLPWVRGKKILGCNLEYYGLCASCLADAKHENLSSYNEGL